MDSYAKYLSTKQVTVLLLFIQHLFGYCKTLLLNVVSIVYRQMKYIVMFKLASRVSKFSAKFEKKEDFGDWI